MKIHEEKDALKLTVSGINMNFVFDYQVWTEPEGWVEDKGSGDVKMHNSDIGLELSLTSKNGALQVDFSEVNISLEAYEVKLDGDSDFSRAVQILFKNF